VLLEACGTPAPGAGVPSGAAGSGAASAAAATNAASAAAATGPASGAAATGPASGAAATNAASGAAATNAASAAAATNAASAAAATNAASAAAATNATGASTVTLPAFAPVQVAAPDFPGTPDGILPPAYMNYPRNPLKTVTQPVGKGDDVNAMMYTTQAPPTPMEQNTAWQQVNKELGVNMKLPLIQLADYPTKLNTTIAGGQLPDLLSLGQGNGSAVANLPDFLSSLCTDLTPFVAGDAVKAFPNLANLPTYAWRNAVFNNRIYAIPDVRASISGSIMFGKGKLLEPVGGVNFKNADDFLRATKQLTVGGNQWGLGVTSGAPINGLPGVLIYFLESFGVPNIWRQTAGKLTKDFETDEFKAAVAFTRTLWDAGVMHPDSPNMQINQAAQNFYMGKTALWANGFTIGDVAWNRATAMDPDFRFRAVAPFSHDGTAKPVHHLGPGTALLTVLKKTDADHVKELLGVLNYFAAPFGSAEFLLIWYGIEGKQFTFDANGNPIATSQQGVTNPDLFIPWPNIGSPASVLYDANSPEYARVMYQDASIIQGMGIQNPVVGLYSATNAKLAATLNQKMGDGLNNIIFGRDDVSALDQLVKDWRAQGGDTIRAEFEAALQKQ
jgi:putative aldouronate transport system substrate-binding protein